MELGVNVEKFKTHKSVDDAMMTMLCLKSVCKKLGKSAEEILTENKGLFVSNEQILQQSQERRYKKEILEKIKRLFGKKNPMPRYKTVLNQKFEINGKLLQDVDTSFELVKKIYENGGTTYEHLFGEGYIIFEKEPSSEIKNKIEQKSKKIILLEEIMQTLK